MTDTRFRGYTSFFGFALLFLLPSVPILQKYFGMTGVIAYSLTGFLGLLISYEIFVNGYLSKLTEKHALILTLLTFFLLIVLVEYVYPIANSGRFGRGSDADEALIIAATELVSGNYPYYAKTYLDNPISPMPGTILLAAPFVLLGSIELQNIFWLGVFFGVVRSHLRSSVWALALLLTLLVFSPIVMQNLVTGADYLSNTIYILVFMWLMVTTISRPDTPEWKKLLPTIMLGVGLSSRSNFILLIPLLFSILVQNAGWKPAIKFTAIAVFACAIVTIPFWLYDPQGFAPLIVQSSKISQLESVLPYAGIIIPLSGLLLTSALSRQEMRLNCAVFFRNCAIVQLFILLFTSVVYSLNIGRFDLFAGQPGYGMFILFFGAFAGWIILNKNRNALTES